MRQHEIAKKPMSMRQFFEWARNEYLAMAQNDAQREIFNDWWNGKCLWKWNEVDQKDDRADGYEHYSEADWYAAGSLMLEACSDGLG